MGSDDNDHRLVVRGTELLPDDPRQLHRQKLARITLDSMIQFVGLLDAEGTVLEINQVALDGVGLTLADVEGRPFWTTFWWQVSPEINATLRDSIRRAAQGELVRWDTAIYGRAGGTETIIVDASLCPVKDEHGKVVFLAAEGRDITEKKAQERELAQNHVELQGLLERIRELDDIKTRSLPPAGAAAPATADRPRVLVVEDDPDTNRFVSECLSRDYEVFSAFDGRDGLEQAVRHHPRIVVSDIMMPDLGGVEMIAEMRKLPALATTPIVVLSAKADEALMVKLLEDGAQDFLVKPFSEHELRVRVRNLVAAERLRDVAESANRAKDEFMAVLGHELRNPLAPILTALQLMKLRGEAGSLRERTVIERQITHLTRLVEDLLDVSRITRGRLELKRERVEMSEIVTRAIELASPLLEERTHTLTVDVPRTGLRVDGDVTRLAQVISNLLTNAAKYTPSGGAIAVRAAADGDEVVVSVRDTGIGITAEMLPQVFELFVQERQALDRAQGGLGLGLTIVRSLVAMHGGTVSVRSEGPDQGSEFVVRLPANERPRDRGVTTPPRPGLDPAAVAAPRIRILVVDDNEDAADMLGEVLTSRGYDARVAHDAPEALALAATFTPDVALLDIGLPMMDGYELAALLRAVPGLADVRLIAVTGYGQESDRQRTRAAGFHHHLVKPVNVAAVEAAVKASRT